MLGQESACDGAEGVPLVADILQAETNRLGVGKRTLRHDDSSCGCSGVGFHGFGFKAEVCLAPSHSYRPGWEEVTTMDISGDSGSSIGTA